MCARVCVGVVNAERRLLKIMSTGSLSSIHGLVVLRAVGSLFITDVIGSSNRNNNRHITSPDTVTLTIQTNPLDLICYCLNCSVHSVVDYSSIFHITCAL